MGDSEYFIGGVIEDDYYSGYDEDEDNIFRYSFYTPRHAGNDN